MWRGNTRSCQVERYSIRELKVLQQINAVIYTMVFGYLGA